MIPDTATVLANGAQMVDATGAAAIAVGLSALGAGYAENGIGSAAMGAIAEDESLFVNGLILTVIPETLVILVLVVFFLILFGGA